MDRPAPAVVQSPLPFGNWTAYVKGLGGDCVNSGPETLVVRQVARTKPDQGLRELVAQCTDGAWLLGVGTCGVGGEGRPLRGVSVWFDHEPPLAVSWAPTEWHGMTQLLVPNRFIHEMSGHKTLTLLLDYGDAHPSRCEFKMKKLDAILERFGPRVGLSQDESR